MKRKIRLSNSRKPLGIELSESARRLQVLQLAYQGMSINAIAKRLGLGYNVVSRYFWEEMESVQTEISKYAHLLPAKYLAEYRYLRQKLQSKVDSGDTKAIAQRIKIIDAESKLLGLYPREIVQQENKVIIVNFPGSALPQNDDLNTPMLEDYDQYSIEDSSTEETTSNDEDTA